MFFHCIKVVAILSFLVLVIILALFKPKKNQNVCRENMAKSMENKNIQKDTKRFAS